jgi:hypothetical protein
VIHWHARTGRMRAVLRVARVLAGSVAALLGVATFFASPAPTATGGLSLYSRSVMLTLSSLILVAVGIVIMVGPDKINEIATRNRR